ncbi:hypothetical protein [Sporomusa aerivorans]|uniref:hypothetical protein n=1 Tax=Sporomusa aerivorans TaxID=204936 RepID=UPI00352B0587
MPNDTDNIGSSSLLHSITRMLDASVSAGTGIDSLITVLSLLCLFSITSRNQPVNVPQQNQPAANSNPLHKLLGDLTKGAEGGGGLPPDALMSLLPLLNSPQLKSKLNPSTIGSVLGLLNNLGGGGSSQEKPKSEPKAESKVEAKQEAPRQTSENAAPPAAAPERSEAPPRPQPASTSSDDAEELEGKNYGRYLNWKNNF